MADIYDISGHDLTPDERAGLLASVQSLSSVEKESKLFLLLLYMRATINYLVEEFGAESTQTDGIRTVLAYSQAHFDQLKAEDLL